MNEHDLHEHLARSTSWAEALTVDPAADLARGRRRLRRRRAAIGGGSAFAVALVATGGSLTAAQLGGPADPAGQPPAAGSIEISAPNGRIEFRGDGTYVIQPTPGGATYTCTTKPQTGEPKPNHLGVLASHVDPGRQHLTGRESGVLRAGGGVCGPGPAARASSDWAEGGGTGIASVLVLRKEQYGPTTDGGIPRPRADVCGLVDDRSTFTNCWVTTTAAGQQVRVGTRGQQAYWASYVRPDGQLAVATVEGDSRRADPGSFGGAEPATQAPVGRPSVTLAGLIATVTDPSLDTAP